MAILEKPIRTTNKDESHNESAEFPAGHEATRLSAKAGEAFLRSLQDPPAEPTQRVKAAWSRYRSTVKS